MDHFASKPRNAITGVAIVTAPSRLASMAQPPPFALHPQSVICCDIFFAEIARDSVRTALDHADCATRFAALGPFTTCTVSKNLDADDGLSRARRRARGGVKTRECLVLLFSGAL
jgi:hypothetical protein